MQRCVSSSREIVLYHNTQQQRRYFYYFRGNRFLLFIFRFFSFFICLSLFLFQCTVVPAGVCMYVVPVASNTMAWHCITEKERKGTLERDTILA